MRSPLSHRKIKSLLIPFLGIAAMLCLGKFSYAGSQQFTDFQSAVCGVSKNIQPQIPKNQVTQFCGNNANCMNTFKVAWNGSDEFNQKSKEICDRSKTINLEDLKVSGFQNQQELLTKSLQDIGDLETLGKQQTEKMQTALKTNREFIKGYLEAHKTDPVISQNQPLLKTTNDEIDKINKANQQPSAVRGRVKSLQSQISGSTITGTELKPNLLATLHGTEFINNLNFELKKQSEAKSKISGFKNKVDEAAEQQGPPAKDKPSTDGGNGLASLLPLAGPAAQLASAMMNKPKESDSDLSGFDQNQNQPAQTAQGASLNTSASNNKDSNAGSNKVGFKVEDNKTDPSSESAESPYGYGSSVSDADFNNGNSGNDSAGRGVASTGLSTGGSGAMGGGGPSSDSSEKSSGDDLLIPKSMTDESLGAFGGGGGGGGSSFGGFDSSTDTSTNAGMDDLFKGIEDASSGEASLEDAFNLDGEAQGSGEIGAENGENLFTRVRLCYQRSMKKGSVLNNVPEKVF
ncbi:MAG: hypothetical protein M9962_03185 [Oligoflexia bacterium]|nr:hypothetical protein [Oligoflexia bacterium]